MSVTIFLDTQMYLDLFESTFGRKLLNTIEEQKDHIFVTAQIADEILRRKVRVAQRFLAEYRTKLGHIGGLVPDLLFGMSESEVDKLARTLREPKEKLAKLSEDALRRISRSEDDISQRLNAIFRKAKDATAEELGRARDRRERGNPPGKAGDTLGDQISWEQLLTHCKVANVEQLWIISRDTDYGVPDGNSVLLNARLHADLVAVAPSMKVHAFKDLVAGFKDFGQRSGIKVERLPTAKETAEIRKEISTHSPAFLGWFSGEDLMKGIPLTNARLHPQAATYIGTYSNMTTPLGSPRGLLEAPSPTPADNIEPTEDSGNASGGTDDSGGEGAA